MNHHEVTIMFLSLGVLLGAARLMGEIARRMQQPAVLGEILAGILLGPTVLGAIWPEANLWLFPPAPSPNALVHSGLTTFAVTLFLLVAGMEVDLSTIFRLRSSAMIIGLCGLITPFGLGFGLGQLVPGFMGMEPGSDKLVFSLFLGIAMAISALPVIAKTLMDLNLYRSDLGMVVIAVAIFHDLVGWIVFAIILAMMKAGGHTNGAAPLLGTVVLTLTFAAVMLTFGRWAINRALPWLQAHASWPGGVLGFALCLGLLGAAFTEWIGIHAIFGAFIVGVALGDSPHLQQRTRATMEQFISFVFAPLFFASIGLRVNFITHFDWVLVLTILTIACIGETVGCAVGALWAGFPKRQSWAIGLALNARGAMEIVLALLALQYGVIGERLFVALVVMALVTSIIAGPLMQRVLNRGKTARFRDFINSRLFVPALQSTARDPAIQELASLVGSQNLNAEYVYESVLRREQTMSTALPNGLAIPHARLVNMDRPIVVVGMSPEGIDWDASDGKPAKLILMVLTPFDAAEAQLEILADISRTFAQPDMVERALACKTFTQFLALLNIQDQAHQEQISPAPA